MSDQTLLAFVKEVLLKDPQFVAKYGKQLGIAPSADTTTPAPKNKTDADGKPVVKPTAKPAANSNKKPAAKTPAKPTANLRSESVKDSPDSPVPSPLPPMVIDDIDSAEEYEAQFSPCESDSEATSSEDGYTVVAGKKRARKAKASSGTPAKSQKTDATPSASQTSSAGATQATPPSPRSQPRAAPKIKTRTPPPLIIQDKGRWTEISKTCAERKIQYTHARTIATGIKVQVPTPTDFRSFSNLLNERKVAYHTYSLQEEKPLRVVIRGIPKEIASDDILSDLKSQNIPALEVHRMHRGRGAESYDMVLVVCEPLDSSNSREVFNLKTVCHLSGIVIERPRKNGHLGQCHKCQLYGHSQNNCHAKPRCVKCLGDHGTSDCSRPKDRTLCTEPPSCVLCGLSGHPANYRGCSRAPKAAPKAQKRNTARLQREAPSSALPERLAPQRPSPWNALNHQRAFPALKPTVSAPLANPIPPPPATVPQTAQAAIPPPPKAPVPAKAPAPKPAPRPATATNPSAGRPSSQWVLSVALQVFQSSCYERLESMALAMQSHQGDPIGIVGALLEHADVLESLKNLKF